MIPPKKPPGALRLRPHSLEKRFKKLPWLVCRHCGLVALKNQATADALRVGCWIFEDE